MIHEGGQAHILRMRGDYHWLPHRMDNTDLRRVYATTTTTYDQLHEIQKETMTATNKNISSKRLKTWHRKYLVLTEESERLSLKAFARMLIKNGNENEQSTAKHWLGVTS